MMFPGKNKLILSKEAMQQVLQDALNMTRDLAEPTIRVTDVSSPYSWQFEIELTTDTEAEHVES